MDSRNLTPQQLAKIKQQVDEHLRFYCRLDVRMTQRGFPQNDPIFAAAIKVSEAVRGLSAALDNAHTDANVRRGDQPWKAS